MFRRRRRGALVITDLVPAELVWQDGPPSLASIGATTYSRALARNAAHQILPPANQPTITYTSGTTSVATINSSGVVTAVANGTSVITAASAGLTSITQTATVSQVVASISGPTTFSTDDASSGTSPWATYTPKDANGNTVAGASITYGPSDLNSVFQVTNSSTGAWAGQGPGTAHVPVSSGGVSITVTVTVTHATGLVIGQSPSSPAPGASITYTATYNGADVTSSTAFSTSDPTIVTVDPPTFTAISPTTITQGASGSYTLTGTNTRSSGQSLTGLPSGVTASAFTQVDATHWSVTLTATAGATTGAASIAISDPTHGNSGTQTLTVNSASGMGTLPVTSGLVLRLHANAGVATSGSSVTSWTDQSSTGAVFSQATGANQPTLVSNVYNSKPTVRLSGSQYLVASGTVAAFNTVDYTLFVVCKPSTLTPGSQFAWGNNDTGAHTGEAAGVNSFPRYLCYHGDGTTWWNNFAGGTPSTSALHTLSMRETNGSPTKQRLYADNVSVVSDATNQAANTTKAPVVGSDATTPGSTPFSGDISEIIRFNRALSDTELASMETYFQTEWGTP